MKSAGAEFDAWSASYEELLKDPVRDRFARSCDFFHRRKRDIIREYFAAKSGSTRDLAHLDVGCGKGELVRLLKPEFRSVAGCDPSEGMLSAARSGLDGIEFRLQSDPRTLPFEDNAVDYVTAACVYHHVSPADRARLTREVRRVLKPNGIFAIIEHNPWNPVTRLIVSRTPVDADAILLYPNETRNLLKEEGFAIDRERHFLYFPEALYPGLAKLESMLGRLPFGGQYAIFASLNAQQSE